MKEQKQHIIWSVLKVALKFFKICMNTGSKTHVEFSMCTDEVHTTMTEGHGTGETDLRSSNVSPFYLK